MMIEITYPFRQMIIDNHCLLIIFFNSTNMFAYNYYWTSASDIFLSQFFYFLIKSLNISFGIIIKTNFFVF